MLSFQVGEKIKAVEEINNIAFCFKTLALMNYTGEFSLLIIFHINLPKKKHYFFFFGEQKTLFINHWTAIHCLLLVFFFHQK